MTTSFSDAKIKQIVDELTNAQSILHVLLAALDNEFNPPKIEDIAYPVSILYKKISVIKISIESKDNVIRIVED